MAFSFSAGFLSRCSGSRFHLPRSISPSSTLSCLFSTLNTISNPLNEDVFANEIHNQASLDERFVFDELSDLLPANPYNSVSKSLEENCTENEQVVTKPVDGFLRPDEKLRGVFLQKLKA